ncbi:MAG: CAP domain-containing protein, partial [Planctomycetota bacterium]
SPGPDNSDQTKVEDECIAEHNKHRRSLGLNELQTDEKMRMAARKHSEHMAKVNQLAHEDIGDGTLSSRCAAEGTRCIGENVAKGMTSGAQAVQAWLKSPGHKANIENSRYTAIGCGFAKPFWWTCVFR